jgi:homoserine kinase
MSINLPAMKKIKVTVPATVANLVCGFDILGMALHEPQDSMELELINEPVITIRHTDDFNLPVEPLQNVAGAALQAMMEEYEGTIGFNDLQEQLWQLIIYWITVLVKKTLFALQ